MSLEVETSGHVGNKMWMLSLRNVEFIKGRKELELENEVFHNKGGMEKVLWEWGKKEISLSVKRLERFCVECGFKTHRALDSEFERSLKVNGVIGEKGFIV